MLKIPDKPIPGGHDYSYTRPANISIPARSFKVQFVPPRGICDVPTMSNWIRSPLLTAERTLSLVWPKETEDFCIVTDGRVPRTRAAAWDAELYRPFFFRRFRGFGETGLKDSACKMVIAALIPWALTPQNVDDFVRVRSVRTIFG